MKHLLIAALMLTGVAFGREKKAKPIIYTCDICKDTGTVDYKFTSGVQALTCPECSKRTARNLGGQINALEAEIAKIKDVADQKEKLEASKKELEYLKADKAKALRIAWLVENIVSHIAGIDERKAETNAAAQRAVARMTPELEAYKKELATLTAKKATTEEPTESPKVVITAPKPKTTMKIEVIEEPKKEEPKKEEPQEPPAPKREEL